MRTQAILALSLLTIGLLPVPAAAQTGAKIFPSVSAVSCDFTVQVKGDWKQGEGVMTTSPATFNVSFNEVNVSESSADTEANTGDMFITVRHVGDYLNFLQIKSEGPVYLTTIFAQEGRPGRYLAAHSRHEYLVFALPGYTARPEQYLGDCEITN